MLLYYPLTYCVGGMVLAGLFPVVRSDWWGLLILGGLICLYAVMATKDTATDKLVKGDNCYIIGFVYTLVVITMTLILDAEQLLIRTPGVAAGSGDGNLVGLLETIGVALGTSVIGMMLRTYFNHSVSSSEDEFHTYVRETAVAASQMSNEVKTLTLAMRETKKEFNLYAEALQVESKHVSDELNKSFARVIDELAEKIQNTLQRNLFDEIRDNLALALDANRDAAAQVRDNLTLSLETLNEAVRSSHESGEKALHMIGQLQNSLDHSKLLEMNSVIQDMSAGVKKINQVQTEMIGAYQTNLRDWGSGTTELVKQYKDDIASIAKLKVEFQKEYNEVTKTAKEEKEKLYKRLIASSEVFLERVESSKDSSETGDELSR